MAGNRYAQIAVSLLTLVIVAAPARAVAAARHVVFQEPIETCGGPIAVVPPGDVPAALRVNAKDVGLVGSGTIWTPPQSLSQAGYWTQDRNYSFKMPWLRSKPGRLRLSGSRLDGPGKFRAETAKPGEYPPVGFEPSSLTFSTDGCWKITARHRRSTFTFYVQVPAAPVS